MHHIFFFKNDIKIILPEFFLFSCTIFSLLIFLILTTLKKGPNLTIQSIFIALQISIITLILVLNNSFQNIICFSNLIIINKFNCNFKIIILIFIIIKFLVSLNYFKYKKIVFFEYTIIILLIIFSLFILISAYDFLTLYFSIELISLASYILTSLKRNSIYSTEAGLKYFILSAFASSFLLLGISLIYGFTGTTNFYEICKINILLTELAFLPSILFIIGFIFLLSALLFKIAAAPFHTWLPDIFEGAPLIVTFFFAILPKMVILSILIQLCFNIFPFFIITWSKLILFSGILSIILGTSLTLFQPNLKRFLAYSAISHIGFILLGLNFKNININYINLFSIFFYNITYIFISIGFFIFLLSLLDLKKLRFKKYITELNGLNFFNLILALSILFLLFSFSGIPPLIGFFSKFYILQIILLNGNSILIIIVIIHTLIMTIYYLRLLKIIFFQSKKIWIFYSQVTKFNSILLFIIIYFQIIYFVEGYLINNIVYDLVDNIIIYYL